MQPLRFENKTLLVLDQTRLPNNIAYLKITRHTELIDAINKLCIRGAPAIGIAAGYGIALGARHIKKGNMREFLEELEILTKNITSTRPTAYNLFRVANTMRAVADRAANPEQAKNLLMQEAVKIHNDQCELDLTLSRNGSALVEDNASILTHCNTGRLATGGYGTALGVIAYAHRQNKKIKVIATETRPLLQGARLTALELREAGIPFHIITDLMAGHLMQRDRINMVITGADRIAANGDTANKIGTYSLAILARQHNIPFYIAAPSSTFDCETKTGKDIVIEERSPEEVTHLMGTPITTPQAQAFNPAFDITPSSLITSFITEKGIIPPGEVCRLNNI